MIKAALCVEVDEVVELKASDVSTSNLDDAALVTRRG